MKSLINFPEEVVMPSSSCEIQTTTCQACFKSIGFDHSDCEIDRSTSSTITDSETDSVDSDYENDTLYNDPSADVEGSSSIQDDIIAVDEVASNHPRQQRRSVSFGPIHVRQYERIVGDHPETKVGVPLSIGWAYNEDEEHPDGISIERYECDRIRRGKVRLSSITRKNMMINVFELPEEEIRLAEKRSKKLKKQREKSKMLEGAGSQTPLKKLGKKIRKSGMSVLKGISYASQVGMSGSGGGLAAAAQW